MAEDPTPTPNDIPQPATHTDSLQSHSEYDYDDDSDEIIVVNEKNFRPKIYQYEKELGRGAFGIVTHSKVKKAPNPRLDVGMDVAIKHMFDIFPKSSRGTSKPLFTKRVIREIRMCRILGQHHPNLLDLHDLSMSTVEELESRDSFKTFKGLSMVMPYFTGTLKHHFANPKLNYSEEDVKSIMVQCLSGLHYMHTANFVHRDLKPENILIKPNTDGPQKWKVVIGDFGLGKCFGRQSTQPADEFHLEDSQWEEFLTVNETYDIKADVHTSHVVTRYWRAPEVSLKQQEHINLTKIDIWSMGCIFGEILQMKERNHKRGRPRQPLFKGRADLHLEPDRRANHMSSFSRKQQREIIQSQQINKIFALLGSPGRSYIDSIKRTDLRRWVAQQEYKPPQDLQRVFPDTSSEGLDLFLSMLQYDPSRRFTAEECLNHAYLRDTVKSGAYKIKKAKPIVEDFEVAKALNDAQLRALVCQEIEYYQKPAEPIPETPTEEEVESATSSPGDKDPDDKDNDTTNVSEM